MNLSVTLIFLGLWHWRRKRARKGDRDSTSLCCNNPFLERIHALYDQIPSFNGLHRLPPPLHDSHVRFVDSPLGLLACVRELESVERVAIDTEQHTRYSYHGKTCLIQLSTGDSDWIIDAVRLKNELGILKRVLENDTILKVVHGGGGDVVWLLRDFRIRLINIFDTEKSCRALGWEQCSLAYLLDKYCDVKKLEGMHLTDWRQRPLTTLQLQYARTDVHWLLYIADSLGNELTSGVLTRDEKETICEKRRQRRSSALQYAVQRSQELSMSEVRLPDSEEAALNAALGIIRNGNIAKRVRDHKRDNSSSSDSSDHRVVAAVVVSLCRWRDRKARALDVSPSVVLADGAIVQLTNTLVEVERQKNVQVEQALRLCLSSSDVPEASELSYLIEDADAVASAVGRLHDHSISPEAAPDVHVVTVCNALSHGGRTSRRSVGLGNPKSCHTLEDLGRRFGMKKKPYENARMLSADGDILCYTDRNRLEWYLRKGLAVLVEEDPMTVRLTFAHNESDQRSNQHEFYAASRINRCVGCGRTSHYLKYRIVPHAYRRALPTRYKSHRSHDVLLLCVVCHQRAQQAAAGTMKDVAVELGVPLNPPLPKLQEVDEEKGEAIGEQELSHQNVRKAAIALFKHGACLPQERREELEKVVKTYVRAMEPWLQSGVDDRNDKGGRGEESLESSIASGITDGEIMAGMLAGKGLVSRRRNIRHWVRSGVWVPGALRSEIDNPGGETSKDRNLADSRTMGHAWHGREVVEKMLKCGGDDALNELLARFRRSFVEAVSPQYLPAGWQIDHCAPRSYGKHSIYS